MNESSLVTIHDAVNHPQHYTRGAVECIDAIQAALGDDGYKGYCQGQIMKYVWRFQHKNGVEDLRKAGFYLNELIKQFGE